MDPVATKTCHVCRGQHEHLWRCSSCQGWLCITCTTEHNQAVCARCYDCGALVGLAGELCQECGTYLCRTCYTEKHAVRP